MWVGIIAMVNEVNKNGDKFIYKNCAFLKVINSNIV